MGDRARHDFSDAQGRILSTQPGSPVSNPQISNSAQNARYRGIAGSSPPSGRSSRFAVALSSILTNFTYHPWPIDLSTDMRRDPRALSTREVVTFWPLRLACSFLCPARKYVFHLACVVVAQELR